MQLASCMLAICKCEDNHWSTNNDRNWPTSESPLWHRHRPTSEPLWQTETYVRATTMTHTQTYEYIRAATVTDRPTSEPPFLSVIHCPDVQNWSALRLVRCLNASSNTPCRPMTCKQRTRDLLRMRYINWHFTYLLTTHREHAAHNSQLINKKHKQTKANWQLHLLSFHFNNKSCNWAIDTLINFSTLISKC